MRIFFILLLVSLLVLQVAEAQNSSTKNKNDIYYLCKIAFKNVNFSSYIPEDSILNLCLKLQEQFKDQESSDSIFVISEIEVNSLCLKGEMGLALNKAKQMYAQAKKVNNQLGIGLAFQAIGETYLHSGQYKKANESFLEASQLIESSSVVYSKLKLLFQQMYVCIEIQDTDQLKKYIDRTVDLADDLHEDFHADVDFYIECYKAMHAIAVKNEKNASTHVQNALSMRFKHNIHKPWKYHLSSRYYELMEDYEKSLIYNDSVLACHKDKNPNAYLKFLIPRAEIYEQNGEIENACKVYEEVNRLSDSLKMSQYTSQVDSLHVMYWVDQMKVKNATSNNNLLAKVILYNVLIVLIISAFITWAISKNRQLKRSQVELAETRYKAADSIQSKSLFLSNMSHELRTPLSAIVGFTGLLAENNEMDAQTKKQCEDVIKMNSKLLLKLINDIADISELKENRFNFVWGIFDVVPICQSVIDSIDQVKQNEIVLSFKTDLKKLEIETDKERLQQVLINLLTNANKFTTKGSITLKLELSQDKKNAIFSVEDTGCGVPLHKQKNIFNRFEKLNENIQGVGLGLSISQLIIEHAGGEIWLDAKYTEGARFTFTHPVKRSIVIESINE